MADYLGHWLSIGEATSPEKLPRIFYVNWFRKGADGKFLWPGYGENSRVVKWIFERVSGAGEAVRSAIGWLPGPGAIDTEGLDLSDAAMAEVLQVDPEEWRAEVPSIEEHFAFLGDRVPQALHDELDALEKRLSE
jgi:phosphoenolpyruvate carboxykinase (GTP)